MTGIIATIIGGNIMAFPLTHLCVAYNEKFRDVMPKARGRENRSWHSMGEKYSLRIRFDRLRPMFDNSYTTKD